jgi:hypothetical protein
MLFSLGPKFDEGNIAKEGFPVSKKFWFDPKTHNGIITRVKLKDKLQHIGTFQKSK